MTKLRNNIIANFGGQAWAMVMGVAFVPIYIRVLGIEAYGLIGFFLSIQAFFLILDLGLSATLNRELARDSHSDAPADVKRDLVRTLEWIYWPTGLLIAVGTFAASGPLASSWLRPVSLTIDQAAYAITLMGLSAALQWPCGFYSGGFRGLERQVMLNGLNASFATLRGLGAVAVLLLVSPTFTAFLWWQVAVSALQTAVSGTVLWRLLPPGSRAPRFGLERLHELSGFALGMTGIVGLSFVLVQSDRIILSTVLPLGEFGYYTVAATVAAALSSVVYPFFGALFPRFSGLVATGDTPRLITLYHQSNQLLAVVVAPVACVLSFFSADVLHLWTGDAELAAKSGPILSILVLGTALNGLMNLPYALQLAYGWTKLALYQNMVAVLLVVPSIWWLAHHYGSLGAATVWLALNLCYVTIGVPLMHRRLLVGEMARWYRYDILPPVLGAVTSAAAARALIQEPLQGRQGLAELALIGITCLFATALCSSEARMIMLNPRKLHSR